MSSNDNYDADYIAEYEEENENELETYSKPFFEQKIPQTIIFQTKKPQPTGNDIPLHYNNILFIEVDCNMVISALYCVPTENIQLTLDVDAECAALSPNEDKNLRGRQADLQRLINALKQKVRSFQQKNAKKFFFQTDEEIQVLSAVQSSDQCVLELVEAVMDGPKTKCEVAEPFASIQELEAEGLDSDNVDQYFEWEEEGVVIRPILLDRLSRSQQVAALDFYQTRELPLPGAFRFDTLRMFGIFAEIANIVEVRVGYRFAVVNNGKFQVYEVQKPPATYEEAENFLRQILEIQLDAEECGKGDQEFLFYTRKIMEGPEITELMSKQKNVFLIYSGNYGLLNSMMGHYKANHYEFKNTVIFSISNLLGACNGFKMMNCIVGVGAILKLFVGILKINDPSGMLPNFTLQLGIRCQLQYQQRPKDRNQLINDVVHHLMYKNTTTGLESVSKRFK